MYRKHHITLCAAALLFLSMSQPAYAYLDPGTGSIMLQALFGVVAGALVAGKLYWTKIKGFFGQDSGSGVQEDEKPQ